MNNIGNDNSLDFLTKTGEYPTLKIHGRSGCHLEIIKDKNEYFVTKYANNPDYNERLQKQAKKQVSYYNNCNFSKIFKAPEVREEGIDNVSLKTWFKMEYVSGVKVYEYIAISSKDEVKLLTKHFLDYFDNLFQQSTLRKPPFSTIEDKINSLNDILKLRSNEVGQGLIDKLSCFLRNRIPTAFIHEGFCHGDFTLSNMLIGKEYIYIFDFLDSFIESPVIDLVKLRQDTNYFWTALIDKSLKPYELNKAKIALGYIDKFLEHFIKNNDNAKQWYDYLEIFNFTRILPYVHQHDEILFLKHHLETLLNRIQE